LGGNLNLTDVIAKDTRILVADDEEIMRDTIVMQLQMSGFKNISEVENGLHALQELSNKHYDLLITDTNMPGLNGYQVIRGYKANPQHNGTKFLAMGGGIDQETQEIYASQGVSFLNKPFRRDELLYAVNQVLKN
jgi:CheY-like chemotaxis protein